jgi:hypothetical protein
MSLWKLTFFLLRGLVSLPLVTLGASLGDLGVWISPVRRITMGGIYADMDAFTVSGFGEDALRCENLDIAQSVMQHRMNREFERYRSAVEEQEEVQAEKRSEASV